jgi:Flp pilus assembly protein TadB
VARPNVSKHSRKRTRGKARGAASAATATAAPPAPKPAASTPPPAKPRPARRQPRERPPAPWGAFPLTELAILAGLVGIVVGFTRGPADNPLPLFVGLAVAGLAVVELSWREHSSGFRSHTVLLAFAPVVIFTAIMYTVLGPVWSGAVALAGGVPLFSYLFWHLRRIWHEAQLRRPY